MLIKDGTLMTRVTRNAVLSAVAGGVLLMPDAVSPEIFPLKLAGDVSLVDFFAPPAENTESSFVGQDIVPLTIKDQPSEWTSKLEKEFRELALKEARGTSTADSYRRLEDLNYWRDTLLNERPAEEVLLQLKRDRILEKMAAALEEYVEFQQASHKKSFRSR